MRDVILKPVQEATTAFVPYTSKGGASFMKQSAQIPIDVCYNKNKCYMPKNDGDSCDVMRCAQKLIYEWIALDCVYPNSVHVVSIHIIINRIDRPPVGKEVKIVGVL